MVHLYKSLKLFAIIVDPKGSCMSKSNRVKKALDLSEKHAESFRSFRTAVLKKSYAENTCGGVCFQCDFVKK